MSAAAISIVGYMHRLKQAGFTDQQSEVQAGELEQMFANMKQDIKQGLRQEIKQEMQAGDLATKRDLEMLRLATKQDLDVLRLEIQKDLETLRLVTKKDIEAVQLTTKNDIEKLRYESLRFVVWTGVGVVVTLGSMMTGMLAKGFHWF